MQLGHFITKQVTDGNTKMCCNIFILALFLWPPGVFGILGEWPFIFRELVSTGNYLRGAREQAQYFGDLGSLAKKQKNKEKPPFFFFKVSSAPGGG